MQAQLELKPNQDSKYAIQSHRVILWPDSIAPIDLGWTWVDDMMLDIILTKVKESKEPPAKPAPTPRLAGKEAPLCVHQALWRTFPDQYNEICESLFWSYDHYAFTRWGMYVGVEEDGYIHT